MQEQRREPEHDRGPEEHPHKVTVTVDSQPKAVRRGKWVVREFKAEVEVDDSRVLDQVVDGEFRPLDDNASIKIKGGEVFVSHVRHGGSS